MGGDGFAEQVKVVELPVGARTAELSVRLIGREAPQAIAAIEAGGEVAGRDGVKVSFPPGARWTPAGGPPPGRCRCS